MKILYLHPRAWTGEYPVLVELTRLGHQVVVLEERRGAGTRVNTNYFGAPGDGIKTLWFDPSRGGMRLVTWLPDRIFRRAFDGRNLVHRLFVIREAVRKFRPDVVISSDGFSYGLPAAWCRRLRLIHVPVAVSYIGGDILDCPEADVGHRRTPMVDRLLRGSYAGADVLRPVSPRLESILLEEGAVRAHIQVIPSHLVSSKSTLDRVAFERDTWRAKIRAQHGLAPDTPIIVTLSGNAKGKGLHLLAQIWPDVIRVMPDTRWLLCGDNNPWLAEAVWPVLKRAGVDHTVVSTGRLEGLDVFRHLAASDIHVNPSLCESLNMVTVEAAAVGTPTISSDGAGVSDWISRHGAGAVVRNKDVGQLRDAIIFALHNPERLKAWRMALPGMTEEFSLERVAARLSAMLESMRDRRTIRPQTP